MPPVLEFNRSEIEDRIEAAAAYLGIPDKLGELGVGTDRIDELAEMAIKDPSAGGNPKELTLEAAKSLFKECI